jgi:hypothetical protein
VAEGFLPKRKDVPVENLNATFRRYVANFIVPEISARG